MAKFKTTSAKGTHDSLEPLRNSFAAGSVVFEEGDLGLTMFVIESGEVEIHKVLGTGDQVLAVLGKGDFFGEISLLLGEPPVADVVAEGPVRALQLAGPELREFLLAYPQVMYRMLQAVSRRLDLANRRS